MKIDYYKNEMKEVADIAGITKQGIMRSVRNFFIGAFVTFVPLKSSTVHFYKSTDKVRPLMGSFVEFAEHNKPADTYKMSTDSFLNALNENIKRARNIPRMPKPNLYTDVSQTRYEGSPKFLENYLSGVLKGKSQAFCNAQDKYNINAAFLISIANHESGHGTSPIAKSLNNIGGMRTSNGYIRYNSVEACIDSIASNLQRNYVAQGLKTPPKIGKKYCESDNWSESVVALMREIHRGTQCNIYRY